MIKINYFSILGMIAKHKSLKPIQVINGLPPKNTNIKVF